jgi:hypothetical protein
MQVKSYPYGSLIPLFTCELENPLGAPRAERGIAQHSPPLLDSIIHHTLFLRLNSPFSVVKEGESEISAKTCQDTEMLGTPPSLTEPHWRYGYHLFGGMLGAKTFVLRVLAWHLLGAVS